MERSQAATFYWNGSICCLCFLIGTLGNIVSFLYFKSKKKDISSVIYMLITANDIVVSIIILPVGISFLSKGQPGIIFSNNFGCIAWENLWRVAISCSVFLVLCLCVTRTISLMRPFQRQKLRYLAIAVVANLVVNLLKMAYMTTGAEVKFSTLRSRCDSHVVFPIKDKGELYGLAIVDNILFTAPVIVVAVSCMLSMVVLKRRNENVQQRELQQSRNRATVTILLFALLYGVCNLPLVISYVLYTFCLFTEKWGIYYKFYQFDRHLLYQNTETTLLLAANSAANPILYFWRMPALREYIMKGIRRMLGLNREVRRRAVNIAQQAETRRWNTVVENINIAPLPSTEHLESQL